MSVCEGLPVMYMAHALPLLQPEARQGRCNGSFETYPSCREREGCHGLTTRGVNHLRLDRTQSDSCFMHFQPRFDFTWDCFFVGWMRSNNGSSVNMCMTFFSLISFRASLTIYRCLNRASAIERSHLPWRSLLVAINMGQNFA